MKKVAVGITAIALGAISYAGTLVFINQYLPTLLETELSKTLNRKVLIGQVKSFSLTGFRLGPSSIPKTPTKPNQVSLQAIEVSFNPLPLLLGRPLSANINLVEPDVEAQQNENGELINTDDIKEPQSPVPIDTNIQITDGEITLLPLHKSTKLTLQLDGTVTLPYGENQPVKYSLAAAITDGKLKLKGETLSQTGQSKVSARLQNLPLVQLISFFPNSPVSLTSGELDADLDISLPSFNEIPSVHGTAFFEKVEAQAEQLPLAMKASALLRFQGQRVLVEETKGSYGSMNALVSGKVDWEKGFDLAVDVKPFSLANLLKTVPVKPPVAVDGEMQAKVQVTGPLKQPVMTGTLSSLKTTQIDKVKFAQIHTNFLGDSEQLLIRDFQAIPVTGGRIKGRGQVKLSADVPPSAKDTRMPLAFDLSAELPNASAIASPYGLPANIALGKIAAQAKIWGTTANPQALLKWQAQPRFATDAGDINVSGTGEVRLVHQNVLPNTKLKIGKGTVIAEGRGNLKTGNLAASATLSQIELNRLGTPVPITLQYGRVNLSGQFGSLDPATIQASADINLDVEGETVAVSSKLNFGDLLISATASQIQLANFGAPIAAQVSGKVNVLGDIKNLNPQALLAKADIEVDVAQGTVDLIGQLERGQWRTDIKASNIDASVLSHQLLADRGKEQLTLPALNAQLSLSGALDPLLKPSASAVIKANSVSVQLEEQSLNASGLLTLSNLTTTPEVSSLDLDIAARSHLDTLPNNVLVSQAFPTGDWRQSFNTRFTGQADFKGRLQGKNLALAPLAPGNLNLTGNLQLLDFAVNNVVFEPVLAGNMKAETGREVAIDLRGERDVIAARLDPCTARRCLAPYLPASFELRQGQGTANPILAVGKRDGDRLDIQFADFSLAVLNLAPATQFGIREPVGGQVTGALDINLSTLATAGDIQINEPSVGYIKAKKFAGRFSYDNDLAQLITATLELGQSRYELNGDLNLGSGELNGKVKIASGQVQDILSTFKWFTLQDLTRGIKTPDYASADAVQPIPVGRPEESLFNQLRLLSQIDAHIQQQAAKTQALPTQLDVRGTYTGEINVAGKLANPQLNFEVWGTDWQWHPQQPFADVNPTLGPVIRESPVIRAQRVIAQGSFEEGAITLEPVRIEIGEAAISFVGKLSAAKESGRLQVTNLSLDTVRKLVELPTNIAGNLNAKALLDGNLAHPQVKDGEISFVDGTLNAQPIENIRGNFSYLDSRLRFNTTQPSSLQVQATMPFPLTPEVDGPVSLDVKLGTEAIALVGLLTQGQLEWVDGQGELQLQAHGRLGSTTAFRDLVKDLVATATGSITLNNATIKTAASQKLNLNGEIALSNQRLRVENLQGELAKSKLSVAGVLPLLEPIRTDDPEASNPLTVSIQRGKLDLKGLYRGQVDAEVVINGAALRPVIGGELRANGRASLLEEGLARLPIASDAFQPSFNNFRVVLGDKFRVELSPQRRLAKAGLSLAGAVTVNGYLDNLRPEGTIQLQRGEISLLENGFFLSRDYDSKIEFVPAQGLLNPNLDIKMGTVVFAQSPYQRLEPIEGEIRDDILMPVRAKQVNITLKIKGRASQLLASNKGTPEGCQERQINTNLPTQGSISTMAPEQLQWLTACIQETFLDTESNSQLLNAPLVSLRSVPTRSESEILALLSEQILANVSNIQQHAGKQLLDFAVGKYVVEPVLQDVLFGIQDLTSRVGKKIGLTDLRLLPVLEGIRFIDEDGNSLVGISYDYEFNEFKLQYEMQF